MCSICAGSICAGIGRCEIVTKHSLEIVKISYPKSVNLISLIQSYFASFLFTIKTHLPKF